MRSGEEDQDVRSSQSCVRCDLGFVEIMETMQGVFKKIGAEQASKRVRCGPAVSDLPLLHAGPTIGAPLALQNQLFKFAPEPYHPLLSAQYAYVQ